MMRRKLSFIGGECCKPGALTECFMESDMQRQIRDRFDDECPYSLARTTRRSPRSPMVMRSCNSQVWQVAVNTMAKKRETIKRGVNTVFRSMNRLRTGVKLATQKLRPSTKRRFKLDESPLTPNTPKTRARCILGRTPTKMYSPFAIDTPPSLRRRFAYRRNRNIDTESNKSVNGKSESNSFEVMNANKKPKFDSDKENENYGSLI